MSYLFLYSLPAPSYYRLLVHYFVPSSYTSSPLCLLQVSSLSSWCPGRCQEGEDKKCEKSKKSTRGRRTNRESTSWCPVITTNEMLYTHCTYIISIHYFHAVNRLLEILTPVKLWTTCCLRVQGVRPCPMALSPFLPWSMTTSFTPNTFTTSCSATC